MSEKQDDESAEPSEFDAESIAENITEKIIDQAAGKVRDPGRQFADRYTGGNRLLSTLFVFSANVLTGGAFTTMRRLEAAKKISRDVSSENHQRPKGKKQLIQTRKLKEALKYIGTDNRSTASPEPNVTTDEDDLKEE